MSKNFSENPINISFSEDKELLNSIKKGLQNDEFKMHLQFLVDNKTKKITSAEALSRWKISDEEIIMPGSYIGIMEKSGLIVDFDYYMFEKVCHKLSLWKNTDLEELSISCNITRITLSENNFAARVKEISDKYDFDRNKLILEITEDTSERDSVTAHHNIRMVKDMGFCIALDDIGIGYTSLRNLCEYSIDTVKISRDVLLLSDKERGKKLFLSFVSFIRALDMKVVCEGVETETQNALVSESECDYIQGWYYSKALPEEMAESFAKKHIKV